MSATIFYQPVKGTHLDVGGGKSSFVALLRRVLGSDGPWYVDSTHIEILRGAAAGTEDENYRRAIDVLIDAIGTHGEIRVWAEY